ncbi:hypothetical protein K8353_37935 [Burkholderia contaminans]|nr:hypothetical protein [Burkholderia contaminans]
MTIFVARFRRKPTSWMVCSATMGTRDEKAVAIMRQRISQFDLLMGGVREEVDMEVADGDLTGLGEILKHAGEKMCRLNLLP